jgi:hypothetical protein
MKSFKFKPKNEIPPPPRQWENQETESESDEDSGSLYDPIPRPRVTFDLGTSRPQTDQESDRSSGIDYYSTHQERNNKNLRQDKYNVYMRDYMRNRYQKKKEEKKEKQQEETDNFNGVGSRLYEIIKILDELQPKLNIETQQKILDELNKVDRPTNEGWGKVYFLINMIDKYLTVLNNN